MFHDIPVQMCHFHQKRIIRRYLTNNPRLPAGTELKQLMSLLCDTSEDDFGEALKNWHGKSGTVLERADGGYINRKMALYTSSFAICVSEPHDQSPLYFFTYQKYPELAILNTTNALDGTFAHLKELVNIHRGARIILKTKIIAEILQK